MGISSVLPTHSSERRTGLGPGHVAHRGDRCLCPQVSVCFLSLPAFLPLFPPSIHRSSVFSVGLYTCVSCLPSSYQCPLVHRLSSVNDLSVVFLLLSISPPCIIFIPLPFLLLEKIWWCLWREAVPWGPARPLADSGQGLVSGRHW